MEKSNVADSLDPPMESIHGKWAKVREFISCVRNINKIPGLFRLPPYSQCISGHAVRREVIKGKSQIWLKYRGKQWKYEDIFILGNRPPLNYLTNGFYQIRLITFHVAKCPLIFKRFKRTLRSIMP